MADKTSIQQDLVDVVEEWLDDEQDRQVVINKVNALVDLPYIPESAEGVVLGYLVDGLRAVWAQQTTSE